MGITAGLVVTLRGVIPPAFAGLALAYAGQLTGILQNTVRWASEAESRFTSVDRMQTYLQVLLRTLYHLMRNVIYMGHFLVVRYRLCCNAIYFCLCSNLKNKPNGKRR